MNVTIYNQIMKKPNDIYSFYCILYGVYKTTRILMTYKMIVQYVDDKIVIRQSCVMLIWQNNYTALPV